MTLEHLLGLVGCSPARVQTYRRNNGELREWGFRDTIVGAGGWWYAVTAGERILALGWTLGGPSQRNDEIRRAVDKHMRPCVPEAVSA